MSDTQEKFECPHCGAILQAFELPEAAGYDEGFHFACFNNECPYYKKGWDWMMSQYEVKTSYRYRVNPQSGCASPIAVWSEDALVDRIIEEEPAPAKGPQKNITPPPTRERT